MLTNHEPEMFYNNKGKFILWKIYFGYSNYKPDIHTNWFRHQNITQIQGLTTLNFTAA